MQTDCAIIADMKKPMQKRRAFDADSAAATTVVPCREGAVGA